MRPLSVLLTNNALALRGGSETYIRDVAIALLRRGHRPTVFSLVHGDMATELRQATIPVLNDVTRLGEPPDVIHGHHHLETLIATLAFPDVPVVNFCHGWLPWEEMPLHHPAVRRYVAVDEVCVDRLVREEGIPRSRIELLLNFVDLERFRPRGLLPARPVRALVISNAPAIELYGLAIRTACQAAGIVVDIVGAAAGTGTSAPESLLGQYDLVFAKGRTALEALAVGCATILADAAGAGPLVTPANYDTLRQRNFGIRELRQRHDRAWYAEQIARYDAQGAAQVSARVRTEADLDPAITRLVTIYAAVMAAPPVPGSSSRAAAVHCSRIALPLKQAHRVFDQLRMLGEESARARGDLAAQAGAHEQLTTALRVRQEQIHELDARIDTLLHDARCREEEAIACQRAQVASTGHLQAQLDRLTAEAERRDREIRDAERSGAVVAARLQARIEELLAAAGERDRDLCETAAQLTSACGQVQDLQHQVAAFRALPALRLRDAVLRTPVAGPILQMMARRLARRLRTDDGAH